MTSASVPRSSAVKLKNLKVVIYKNKYFPKQYVPRKIRLLNEIMDREKEKLNIKDPLLNSEDEEEIAEHVRQELIALEKRIIFYSNVRPNLPETVSTGENSTKNHNKVPFIILQKHKLRNLFLQLKQEDRSTVKQKQLLICLKNMHHSKSNVWTSPLNLINAINDSLLTRNWNNVTHLLLQLVNYKDDKYKPILRKVYEMMDKLCPVILENDLQGEYKNIQGACKQILDSTTVV